MDYPAVTPERNGMVINAGVANLYRDPAFTSEVVSQAFLGESPEVIDRQGKWFKLRQWDGYEGWVYYFYLVKSPGYLNGGEAVTVLSPAANIRSEPSAGATILRDVVYTSRLPVKGQSGDWRQVALPDGSEGWIAGQPGEFSGTPREQLVAIGRQFLGAPYMWGGKSVRGFDCSGLVQTIYKGLGVDLPRDAHLQHRFKDLPATSPDAAAAGDLFFFSDSDEGITHVAMSTGGAQFIHASGWVKEESLDADDENFNHLLSGMFIGAKDMSGLIDAD